MTPKRRLILAAALLLIVVLITVGSYFSMRLVRDDRRAFLWAVSRSGVENLVAYRREYGCLPNDQRAILRIIGPQDAERFVRDSHLVMQGDDLVLLITPSRNLLADLSSKPSLAGDECYPETTDSYKVTTPGWTPVAVVRVRRCEEGGVAEGTIRDCTPRRWSLICGG